MKKFSMIKTIALTTLSASAMFLSGCGGSGANNSTGGIPPIAYEVWGTDQSNSKSGAAAIGTQGSSMYIWDGTAVDAQIAGGATATPLPCAGMTGSGPCDMDDVFPGALADEDGNVLSDATGFARMHGSLSDPQGKYMNINMFLTGGAGGYVGIMDGRTKEAVALFRVTQSGASAGGRSVHMSFWNKDGSALFVANLHGRIVERIDISRDANGNITNANLNRAAALSAGSGANTAIQENSHAFSGMNAVGNPLVSTVSGTYSMSAFGDFTPAGKCKENGCDGGVSDGAAGGRPGGVIICPIVSDTDMIYLTFGAGGMLVADARKTPMEIVAEYGNEEVNGAGCGGVHVGDNVWLDGGVSATGAGVDRSTFTVYTVNDSTIAAAANAGTVLAENTPAINTVFKDPTNTAPSGNVGGAAPNLTGQVPGTTTRRDAHGMIETLDDKYVHVVDRIQNTMDVFSTTTLARVGGYDLTSANGDGSGGAGPCEAASVPDPTAVSSGDPLTTNDPGPDLMGLTPDGKYIVVALRGPMPITVNHGGQGSCPGVGMIELTNGGASGKLVSVLRASNTTDDATPPGFAGGANYIGTEHADVHGASTRRK